MKKLIFKNVVMSASVVLVATGSALASGPRLVFEKPMILQAADLGVRAERVKLKFDTSANRWNESKVDTYNHRCAVRLNLEGRDLAVKTPVLGEHYFGSMELDCGRSDGLFGNRAFKTRFSRVFFLGIRNCVQSETMIDQDYCTIQAVALRKDGDMTMGQDLVEDSDRQRVFIRVSSPQARTYFESTRLAPEGLNMATVDSFQVFEISIGRSGKEFFIQQPRETSNFAGGRNHYLNIADGSGDRDEQLKAKFAQSLEEIERLMNEIETSGSPKARFEQNLPAIMDKFSSSAKDMLAIISPVEFFHLEKHLLAIESDLVDMTKTFYPAISNRDSFVREYSTKFAAYRDIADYLNRAPSAPIQIPRPINPTPNPTPTPPTNATPPLVTDGRMDNLPLTALSVGSEITLLMDFFIPPNELWSADFMSNDYGFIGVHTANAGQGRVLQAGRKLIVQEVRKANDGLHLMIKDDQTVKEIYVRANHSTTIGSFKSQTTGKMRLLPASFVPAMIDQE